jgi:hypothetical protein
MIEEVWQKARKGDLDGLPDEEARLARIMLDHEDEYFNEFEFADVTYERDYDPETEANPFLHVFIHSVVENQLAERDPLEAYQFYNAMRKRKSTHHEAVHLIGSILAPLMFGGLEEQDSFDLDRYRTLLTKYKGRNPKKIPELLEKEPGLFPFGD